MNGAVTYMVCLARAVANIDNCIGLDLDQPLGVNKTRNLHNCVYRANVAKEFAVHRRDSLLIVDPCEQDPRAHDLSH